MIRDGFAVKVFTIGFSVNAKAERELRDVAEVSGGKYYAASNADELKDALAAATKESLLIKKEKTIDGTPIRGGDSFETAVPLQLNTEYRLDHHQKPDFYDYFYIDGNVGEQVTIVARTLEKGLSMFHGKGSENETPSSAVSLLDPLRDKLKSVTSYGKFRRTEDKLTLRKAGRYFVLVGGNVPQNAEHSLFTIGKVSLGDGGQELDAGNDYSSALPITPGRYDSNWFTMQDDRDVYSFDGKKGEVYQIAVIREAGSTDNINLTVHSEMGDQIVRKFGSSGNPAKSDNFTLPEDGKYYISAWACCGNDVKKYSLVIKKVDASLISSEPAESK